MKYGKSEKPGAANVPVTNENKTVAVRYATRLEHLEAANRGGRLAFLDAEVTTAGQGHVVAPFEECILADEDLLRELVRSKTRAGSGCHDDYTLFRRMAQKHSYKGAAWCTMLFPAKRGGTFGITFVGPYDDVAGIHGQYGSDYSDSWCGRFREGTRLLSRYKRD